MDLWLPSRDGVAEMDRAEAEVMRAIFGAVLPAELAVKDAIGEMAAAGGAQIVAAAQGDRSRTGPLRARQLLRRRGKLPRSGSGGGVSAAILETA